MQYPHMWRYRWFYWYQVCPLNFTEIRWCIIETSSGLPRKFSVFSGNLRTSSKILEKCSRTFVWSWEHFGKSSEIFGKWSEIFGKSSKRRHQYAYIVKRTSHVSSKTWILCSLLFLPLEHKIHIFSPLFNILYIYASPAITLYLD